MRRPAAALLILCLLFLSLSLSCRLTDQVFSQSTPTPTPALLANWACVGSSDGGVACLTPGGWQVFNHANGALASDAVSALTFCPDGRLVVLNSSGLSQFDGEQWTQQSFMEGMYPSKLACDTQNRVWVGYYGGVARLEAGVWQQTSTVALFGEQDKITQDLDAGPDGALWVMSFRHLARYDAGSAAWRVFGEPDDWPEEQTFGRLALDAQGHPWVTNLYGLLHADSINPAQSKGQWQQEEAYLPVGVYDLRWDGQKHLWVGGMDGVRQYSGGLWNKLAVGQGPGQPLGSTEQVGQLVNAVTADDLGRIWVGTDWGLAVFDGERWRGYLMQNSVLADNAITALAVQHNGPAALPETSGLGLVKASGELSGVLVQDGRPLRDAAVRLCGELPSAIVYDQDPCPNRVMLRDTTTDASGAFDFPGIPTGYYYLVARPQDAPKWQELTGWPPLPLRVLVEPGQVKDLDQIEVRSK